jgi:NhaA family Na+:H+ antiporter
VPQAAVSTPPLFYRSPWKRFLQYELLAAGMLAFAAVAAVIIANLPASAPAYHALRTLPISVNVGPLHVAMPLQQWINDVLMCTFFFLVGLQIKYELIVGRLKSPRAASLPILGALGGMLIPIGIYLLINLWYPNGDATERIPGWAIPMSTDIAFVAGCMSLMRRRVPPGLFVFMITLAIVDDLGAVAVIGAMHMESLRMAWFLPGIALVLVAWQLGRWGIQSALFFLALGGVVWACFILSGVHATVAGVFMAFAIPMRSQCSAQTYLDRTARLLDHFKAAGDPPAPTLVSEHEQVIVRSVVRECFYVESALQRILYGLEPFCALLVLPVFAFFNSGLSIDWGNFGHLLVQPVTIGVFLGLFVGKQAGISLFCWVEVKLRAAQLPEGVRFRQLWALSWLGGVGFTMALFLSELAFAGLGPGHLPIQYDYDTAPMAHVAAADHAPETAPHPAPADAGIVHNEEAKTGIFLSSLISALAGIFMLLLFSPRNMENAEENRILQQDDSTP